MRKTFDEVFEDQTKLCTKLKTDEYQASGSHVIIDQGQEQVAGYTNLNDGLFTNVPALIFGDHTRVIKYVDKPFFLGADGVKVLRCKFDDANYRYLYYALKSASIPNTGYNRHFKWLRETCIFYPDAIRQAEIVCVLDGVMKLIEKRQQQLSTLDDLIKARFVEMFGDLAKGVGGYPVEKIGSLVANIVPGWSANGEARQKTCGEKAVLKVSAVTQGYFKPEEHKALSVETEIKKYVFPRKGDLLFSRANTKELVGATAIIDRDYPDLILSDKLWRVIFTDAMNVYYAKYVLSTEFIRGQFSAKSTGTSGSMFNVSADKFRDVAIPVPPRMLQDSFAVFVRQVDKLKSAIQKSLDETGILFNSLMQKYFC